MFAVMPREKVVKPAGKPVPIGENSNETFLENKRAPQSLPSCSNCLTQPILGAPNTEYLTEHYNRTSRALLKHPPSFNVTGGMRCSFTFSSAFEGRPLNEEHLEERLKKQYADMRSVIDSRSKTINTLREKKKNTYKPNFKGTRTGMSSVLGSGFKYTPNKLNSGEYGSFESQELTKRVPVKIQKKYGGPIGTEICLNRSKPKPVVAKNKFLANGPELRGMISELEREAKEVEQKIKSIEGTSGSLKERVAEKAWERERRRIKTRPLALRQGQGDTSLVIPPLNKKLVTSQEVRDILADVEYIEPPNPNPIRNKNTLRSVEANFNTWMNELGRY